MQARILWIALLCVVALAAPAAETKIVLVAGARSHGPGEHEHRAGCMLIQQCLEQIPGIHSIVASNGWPADEAVFEGAAAVLFYADGGGGHPAIQGDRLQKLDRLMRKGVGFAAVHYAVEVPKDRGGKEFLDWIGGYFETDWSVNPHWDAEFKFIPGHEVGRGVKPFKIRDEWYYHMRFQPEMKGVTPILSALPPASTLERPDGPHSGNPAVREAIQRGEIQHLAWVYQRPDGGRGFGFTGAHFHKNWGNDDFRKTVLNALLWVAKVEVPAEGVRSTVSPEDLRKNLDAKGH